MNVTALPTCPLDFNNSTYSCANPYPNCTNAASFEFASLWIITQAIATCPNDTRLFNSQPMLTNHACLLFTHKKAWTIYPAADIWSRLTTWKFPLLQLVAVFPRPPLTFGTECFVLLHLLGDPISTIANLLLKVASCQARAALWKYRLRPNGEEEQLRTLWAGLERTPSPDGLWKALTAIVDSYDEWGPDIGTRVQEFIFDRLTTDVSLIERTNNSRTIDGRPPRVPVSDEDRTEFLKICRLTANALAADRSTKFLPVIVAQCFFIGTIAIAFGRTKDSATGPNPATYINIEGHSIAFSSLYFWIIPAVMIGSIIGVSQTEAAIPRILERFGKETKAKFPNWEPLPSRDHLTTDLRQRSGGIYSWQPKESRTAFKNRIAKCDLKRRIKGPGPFGNCWQLIAWAINRVLAFTLGSILFPIIVFAVGACGGMWISFLIPPVGVECRHIGELFITFAWVVSAGLNRLPIFAAAESAIDGEETRLARRNRFRFIMCKDIVVTAATMGGIMVTQIGVFNQCACYTLWGKAGLALPETNSVKTTLTWRIDTSYPAIAFLCVGFQLVIVPSLLLSQYGNAIRVFLQRDDEKSNIPERIVSFWAKLVRGWKVMTGWAKTVWSVIEAGVRKLIGRPGVACTSGFPGNEDNPELLLNRQNQQEQREEWPLL